MTKITGIIVGCIIRDDGERKGMSTSYCSECSLSKDGCWVGDVDDLEERDDAEIIIKRPFTIFDE